MTETMTDASLDFLMGEPETASGESPPALDASSKPEAPSADEVKAAAESRQKALDDIVDVLMPGEGAEEKPTRQKVETLNPEEIQKSAKVVQPITHNPTVLAYASQWGIGPDLAASYPNDEALAGAAALRELRWRNAAQQREQGERKEPDNGKKTDELPLPEIKLDEDTDPAIKTAVSTLAEHAKRIKDWAEAKIAAQADEIAQLRTGHEQAAENSRLEVEAKNARLFDEKVASWGSEFKELIGVPTETWRQPGTPQHAEVIKLHSKVRQLAVGFASLSGRDPSVEELGGFIDEARYALWPDRIKTAVRNEISNGVKKQRGGVGMRPSRARDSEPPEQGADAAKAAIGDYMAEHGLDPWARRKAS